MTKKLITLYLAAMVAGLQYVLISTVAMASFDCSTLKGCEKKFCYIERQLKIAQKKGNKLKVAGLKRSLINAKEHCTNRSLKEDLVEEIEKGNNEIVEYESDLKEAKEFRKIDKINKYQEKIKEEKEKIKHLKEELADLS